MATPVSIACSDSRARLPRDGDLYRALRQDAAYRFVWIGPQVPELPAYEVVRSHGTADGGVARIEPFAVPPGADERFLEAWDASVAALAGRRGWLGTRLHRSLGPAEFRFVELARWSSPLMHARAAGLQPSPGSRAALYRLVAE